MISSHKEIAPYLYTAQEVRKLAIAFNNLKHKKMKTNFIDRTKGHIVNKPTIFHQILSSTKEITGTCASPSDFKNVELIVKKYFNSPHEHRDLFIAYDSDTPDRHTNFFIGTAGDEFNQ